MTPAVLASVLPLRAALALALAQQFDPGCDEAAAWLAAQTCPDAPPELLARRIRATTRRDRRAGGPHGPAALTSMESMGDLDPIGEHSDPCAILEACQEVAHRPGLAAALAEREPGSDVAAIALRDHRTRRRVQQVLAARRRLEYSGQGCLFDDGGGDE